jgi:hypothetical protein
MSAAKSRREIGARLGLGAAALVTSIVAPRLGLGAAALVTSIVAPMPAQAASCGTFGQPCFAAFPGLLGTCCPNMNLLCTGVVGIPVGSVGYEAEPNERGEVLIWLDDRMADKLGAMRGPGESYSDVILRLVAAGDGIEV